MTDLVLLPGLDGTAAMHAEFLAACTACGSTDAIAYPRDTLLDYAELEQLVRSRLPLDRPFALLGESFSGPIALSIAAHPPPNLKGLILCASFAGSPLPHLASLSAALRFVPVHQAPGWLMRWWLLGQWATPQLEQALHRTLRSVSADVLRFRACIALKLETKAHWSGVEVPALYLRASNDRLMPSAAADLVTGLIPQCRVTDIPGPHLLLQANPLQAAQAVNTFITEISR
ncbi:alpha/beta fold hydrolase [Diaphorobacter caeni]|uniref:alpha/beta fold hydrolase n=1 Tax=Diaphorobacter caeni TaxID=2784387 RepID=UPI0018900D45|nr:alpha/beta hydrolase [Diaphorobacter caeni]MBF5006579.1 alpha/beta hydrolase [Diaphorobacter caeni]